MKFLVLLGFILLRNNGREMLFQTLKKKGLLNLSFEMYKYKSKQ